MKKLIIGKCILGCGRSVATHSKTSICSTCLSNLAVNRRKGTAWMMRYKQKTVLRATRTAEIELNPKGYRLGRTPPWERKYHGN